MSASRFPVLTNGSIAIVPSIDDLSPKSAGVDSSTSVCGPRPTFNFSRVRVSVGGVELDQQVDTLSLNMRTGVFTLDAEDSGSGCAVRHELRALLQYPGMVLHSVTVTIPASSSSSSLSLKLLHEVRAPSGRTRFAGETIASGGSQFVLCATDAETSCASVYLPHTPLSSSAAYNESSVGGRKAWTVLPLSQTSTPGAPTVFTTHVLTVAGHASPAIEGSLKRRLLGILASETTPDLVAQSLIAGHVSAWSSKWNTYVDVPVGASPTVTWALRYAFYNLHSCVSPRGSVDLASTTLGSAERDDDFLVNTLLFVSPAAARALLEEKWKILPVARQVANGDGLDGARFPYAGETSLEENVEDSSGIDPWQSRSDPIAIRVYGTLAAAVDAWNYFRVSKDVDWLKERGWDIIRAAADLVCSLAAPMVQPTQQVSLSGTPTIPASGSTCVGVVGMDVSRLQAKNPAAVVSAAVAVMRAAVEASYALGYNSPNVPLWNAVRYGLTLRTVIEVSGRSILASDATTDGLGPLAVPEPLLALMEPLASLSSSLVNSTQLANNVDYWTDTQNRDYARSREVAIADLLSLQALAKMSQSDPNYSALFSMALDSALSSHGDMITGFGNLRPHGASSSHNDLTMSALLVLAFLQGLAGASVMGGYTIGQLTYLPLGVGLRANAVLPAGWERLVLYGIGPQLIDAVLLDSSHGGGGGGGGGGGNVFVPWTVTTFV